MSPERFHVAKKKKKKIDIHIHTHTLQGFLFLFLFFLFYISFKNERSMGYRTTQGYSGPYTKNR